MKAFVFLLEWVGKRFDALVGSPLAMLLLLLIFGLVATDEITAIVNAIKELF
jgi:hypothetical protein